jgi:2-polyprenyl-3-methyl-5-hydroxy-6-metoxy-1,4-benzoquinol methylase
MTARGSNKESDKWDAIYQSRQQNGETTKLNPAYILQEFHHLLPAQGKALDLASGLGANAMFLAQHNMESHAWDISSTAIEKLKEISSSLNLDINTKVRDVVTSPPEENSFDVIVVVHFLDRQIMPAIIAALRKNGLLFYQTFTRTRVQESGPSSDKYRLGKNELLDLCKDLDTVFYREEGTIGDTESGFRNQALYIGQCKSANVVKG